MSADANWLSAFTDWSCMLAFDTMTASPFVLTMDDFLHVELQGFFSSLWLFPKEASGLFAISICHEFEK